MSQGRLSDDRLARAAAHGEPGAFEQVYARHQAALYGYCLSLLHDPEEARDALQNTMEKAFGAIAGQKAKGGLKAWLFGIAHNECVSLMRRRPGTQSYGEELVAAATTAGPEQRERLGQLVQDLKTLPERQRSALVLRELSGLSSEEIGAALAISPAAAKQAVYEARAALLAQSGGRDMDCRQVQMKLSEADGRRLRGRRLRAHLADCALCTAFGATITTRTADMRVLFPPLGAAVAAQTLAAATSGGGAAAAGKAARTGARSQAAAIGALVAVVAAGALGAVALHSDPDPTSAPPAEAAPAPAKPAKAKPAKAKPAADEPAPERPPAAVTGYTDLGPGVLGTLDGSGGGAAGGSPTATSGGGGGGGGSLPFTGLDLALLALAGTALVAGGALLRRVARAPRL